jgi:predicted enzyme involved in methoxymalonyl-ACP biosynthesis
MLPTTAEEISRVSQLTQRTNQFNSSTIRRTEQEIKEIIANKSMEICPSM